MDSNGSRVCRTFEYTCCDRELSESVRSVFSASSTEFSYDLNADFMADANTKDYRAWYGLGQAYELLGMHAYGLRYFQRASALR